MLVSKKYTASQKMVVEIKASGIYRQCCVRLGLPKRDILKQSENDLQADIKVIGVISLRSY